MLELYNEKNLNGAKSNRMAQGSIDRIDCSKSRVKSKVPQSVTNGPKVLSASSRHLKGPKGAREVEFGSIVEGQDKKKSMKNKCRRTYCCDDTMVASLNVGSH